MADMYYNSKDVDYDAFYRQVGGDRYKPASSVTAQGLAIRPVQTVPIDPKTGSVLLPPAPTNRPVRVSPTVAETRAEQAAAQARLNSIAYYKAINANDVIGSSAPPPQTKPAYQPPVINAATPINGWSLGLSSPPSQTSAVSAIASALAPKVAPTPMTLPGIMPISPASAAPVSRAPSSAGESIIYTIQPGDTLSSIAKDIYGSAQAYKGIAAANNISNPDKIQVGQKIVLGSGTPTTGSPVAKALTSGSTSGGGGSYTIKSGDTLSAIAKANGTTVAELAKKNNISDPNKIFAGASLRI